MLMFLLLLLYDVSALDSSDHLLAVELGPTTMAACLSRASMDECRREAPSSRTSASIATG